MAEEKRKKRYTPEEKRIVQSERRASRNSSLRSKMKTEIKKFEKAVETEASKEDCNTLYNQASKTIDKMVTKGIVHKNAAARKKSRLFKKISE